MSPETAVWLAPAIPLAGAPLIALAGRNPNLREAITLITATLLFLVVLQLVPEVMAGGRPAITVLEMLPGLTLAFEVEPLGMVFAVVASFLWIITTIYSIGYMRGHHEKNQTRFYVCFALALASAMGVAFAGNMLTLFVFYEALTLTTYPLVTHAGTKEAVAAGRTYLGILLGTSIGLQLLAIVWTWTLTGTLDFTTGGILEGRASPTVAAMLYALFLFGIGKAALMPLHRWLPAAMVAPVPVSALLHAVAVVKAGVFTVLKVSVYVFGIDFLADVGGEPMADVRRRRHHPDRIPGRYEAGQPQAAPGLFDREPALLHRIGRRHSPTSLVRSAVACTLPCTPSARSPCSSAPEPSTSPCTRSRSARCGVSAGPCLSP